MDKKLIMMIGLPGSGKSMRAKKLATSKGSVIVSSGDIRKKLWGSSSDEEYDQARNDIVFKEMIRETLESLKRQSVIIYDATNITVANRAKLLKPLSKFHNIKKVAYVTTPCECTCKLNFVRQCPNVHPSAVRRVMQSFQLPLYGEGFDEIILDGISSTGTWQIDNGEENTVPHDIYKFFDEMDGFDLMSNRYDYTLQEHCKAAYDRILEMELEQKIHIPEFVKYAALLHDYGKIYSQSLQSDGTAEYPHHHNIGAYQLMSQMNTELYLNEENIYNMLVLINYHMYPYRITDTSSSQSRYRFCSEEYMGDLYKWLMVLHEADIYAHHPHKNSNRKETTNNAS